MANATSTQNILARLENLKLWQDEQKKILIEKQTQQRHAIMAMDSVPQQDDQHSGIDEISYSDEENQKAHNSQLILSPLRWDRKAVGEANVDGYDQQDTDTIVKRPFLRRGEGLQRRFKVNPNIFKLENLPKYKYAKKAGTTGNQKDRPKPVAPVLTVPTIDNLKLKTVPSAKPVPTVEKLEITWAEILNPHNIDPIPLPNVSNNDSREDLSIFQLIEQRMDNSSYNSQSSSLLQLLDSNRKRPPKACQPTDPLIETNTLRQHHFSLQPHPNTLREIKFFSDESTDDDNEESKARVKFSDQVEVVDRSVISTDEDEETEDETLKRPQDEDVVTSTPNEKCAGHLFNPQAQEKYVLEKSELLKERLVDLETEIDNFRTQNVLLTKAKQDHELEKLQWETLRDQIIDQLKDEKIQSEMYLHDERQKCEKRWQELQKPTRREREETTALKTKVAELEQELKNREVKHSSAQARLRSQIKVLEKENKEQTLELDALKRENKKMEAENARLRRQSNTKMLQEINKNIAKLTPAVAEPEAEKASPVVVTKVTSHQKISRRSKEKSMAIKDSEKRASKPLKQVVASSSSSSSSSSSDSSGEDNVKELQRNALKSSYFKFLNSTDKSSKQSTQQQSPSNDAPAFNVGHSNVSSTPSGSLPATPVSTRPSLKKTPSTTSQKNSVQFLEPPTTDTDPKLDTMTDRATETLQNFKREIANEDGSKDIWYPNGNIKKISSDGLLVKMLYFNKDIKETNVNEGTVKYYYAQTNVWHTTYVDGLEILEFPNGQTEHHYKDGTVEIHFPNGSICINNPNKREIEEEWKYPDGTHVNIYKNGEKILTLPNGQREIHTKDHKRREYPDGTVKLVYPDGSQETRYSNGRIRLKDKDGKLITDTENMTR